MKPVSIKRKRDDTYLLIKGNKTQELNGREFQEIQNGTIGGILRLSIEKSEPYFLLRADLNGLIPLDEFLGMMPLTRKMFAKLLRNILQILSVAEEHHFNKNLFLYDPCYIMVEPSSWQFFFTYVPLQPYPSEGSLKELLEGILQYTAFETAEDTSYVQDFIQILNNGPIVSLFMLEEYLRFLEAGIKKKAEQGVTGSGFFPARTSLIEISTGQRIPITKLPFYIGSLPESCDLVPNAPGISRKHAEIREESGQYVLIDTGSRNGTYVNGKRLFAGAPELIHAGDHVAFAAAEFRFHTE